jgi:hypothetical protein
MTDLAFQTMYRDETVDLFEQDYSMLRICCVQEHMTKGNVATFLVSGAGSATAVTRGVNGLIPFYTVSNEQFTCTLKETHGPFERTNFNIFASQGDQRKIMQRASVTILNQDIDQVILEELDTATQDTGTAVKANLDLVMKSCAILGNAEVPVWEVDNMFGIISPAFHSYLMQIPEFTSADYVEVKAFSGRSRKMRRWADVNWLIHPNLPGKGTNAEKCYLLHRNSIGHAANSKEMDARAGYDEKQDISWSRATLYHNAALLQNSGVIVMNHDGSEYVAS